MLIAGTDTAELKKNAADSDALLILGGDGTIIGTARKLADISIPMAGMNFGRMGFLAELPSEHWESSLSELIAGRWITERHLALQWHILHQEHHKWTVRSEGIAINDVVTAHGVVARAVSLRLHIDDVHFSDLRCDGLIVSTPLGSTAYTASAGGPLTMPSMNAQLVTPICPFSGGFPPLVLPSRSCIQIEACRQGDQVLLSVDGQDNFPLEYGDKLEIRGIPDKLCMLVSHPHWYLNRLIQRGIVTPGQSL
jgi:NAD+ kinase